MAESIITDSSNYSEDFEDSFESYDEYSETDAFPELFSFLEKTLSSSELINYRDESTPSQLAVGLFLSKVTQSKSDFKAKLHWEYTKKRELLQKPLKFEPLSSKFPKTLKSLLCQMRAEDEFITRSLQKRVNLASREVRSQTFLNLAALAKDKHQAEAMLSSEKSAIFKKKEELEDFFCWNRFNELLKTLVPSKISVGSPSEKQKAELRALLENHVKIGQSIKNAISLEDSDYVIALGNKRPFVSSQERKVEVSEVFSEISAVEEALNKFLTFSKRPVKGKSLNTCPKQCLLNRAFINIQKPTFEDSLSQFLFVVEKYSSVNDLRGFDFTTAEEDVDQGVAGVELERVEFFGRKMKVFVRGCRVELRAADTNDLNCLPGSPAAGQVNTGERLYTVYQDSVYTCKPSKKTYLRSLNSSELEELFNIYLFKTSEKKIYPECFPDPSRPQLKYNYLVIKESLILNSGIFSKHWLVQLRHPEPKKSLSDFFMPRVCKWEACMSSLVGETHLTKMATEFSSLTNKVKLISKKGLNPLKKSRTASEAIVVPDLCIFHNNLRSIMRNDGMVTKKLIYDNSIELWKATQAGLSWQEELSENNKLSKLCTGSAKSFIFSFFEQVFESLSSRKVDESAENGFFSQKGQVLAEIEGFKRIKDIESNCTQDLIRIFNSGANSSYLKVRVRQYALVTLQEAVALQTSSKCLKIRSLKDQIESFLALKMQNQTDLNVYQPSFRVSTAKQVELNNTYNESSRKAKEDVNKKTISPYYDSKLRVIKRFQKSRIPRSACDERSYNKS